jgi:nucleotide-binding universal stress UspA family protein
MSKDQFQMNLEALRTMVVVITNDNEYSVKRNDSLPTAACDLKNKIIYLTIKNIPDGLPAWKRERLLDGENAHEAGHVVVTAPYAEAYNAWRGLQKYPNLAHLIENIYEDLRVNFYIVNRYRFSFGGRLTELHRINAKSMVHHAQNLPLTTKRLEKACVALALSALTEHDVTKGLDSEAKDAVRRAASLIRKNKFKRVTRDIVSTVNEAYKLIEALVKRPRKSKKPGAGTGGSGEDGDPTRVTIKIWDGGSQENYDRDVDMDEVPSFLGGNLGLAATKDEVEQAEAEQRKLQAALEKAMEEAQRNGTASGFTTGVAEPHPPTNALEYRKLVLRNTPHIVRLLNKLKTLQEKQVVRKRFARHGRYMVELHGIFKALSKGKGPPYEHRFEGRKISLERMRTKMAVLVDMSGSMNTEEAKDALTVIAETAGRWIASDDFAIAVFGTNHAVVKAFIEPYVMARTRIGGVVDMGCTNMARPIRILTKMLSSYRYGPDRLVLIIVSDFDPTDIEEESKELIQEAEKMGIRVIGCGLCSSDLATVQEFTTRATFVEETWQLPTLFFNVYREAVTGRL